MNFKKLLLPVVFIGLGIGGFAVLKASRPVQPAVQAEERVWRVATVVVAPVEASPVLTVTGSLESPALTKAAAPGVGRVTRVLVREGQPVSPGQILLALDERDFAPKVEQARGQVAELEAAIRGENLRHAADLDQLRQERRLLEFAQADVARVEELRRQNFYSAAAVDQGRAAVARQELNLRSRELAIADHEARLGQLKARLAQAQAGLAQAELALMRARVVAPFAGYVAKLEVAEGDQVNLGQTLVSLYPQDGLEVRAKIPSPNQEEIVARLAQGGVLTATARLAGRSLSFRLARVAGAADTRGLDGFFRLTTPSPEARVGSLVSMQLARPPVAGAIPLPYTALYGGERVFRLENGRLRSVPVEVLGEAAGEPPRLLVKSALLRAGDQLLATHLPNAVSGLRAEAAK